MTRMNLLAAIMCLTAFSIVAEEPKETASDAALKERIGALILKLDDESFEKRSRQRRT